MKMKFVKSCMAVIAAGLLSSTFAMAQEEKAASLDQLLDMVKKSQVAETAEFRQREAEFARDKANQGNVLNQAKATRQSEENRSDVLEKSFADQELLVSQKRAQLNERLGSMKELFGHLTSTAGDLRVTAQNSLVSAQIPNRGDFLNELIEKMNSNTRLPSIAEIERLWYEVQRELVESGRVVKFNAEVVKTNGEAHEQEVVRVGVWNLISDGKYLRYIPESGKIEELSRQPEGALLKTARDLQSASSGFVSFAVDPTGPSGGTLLAALVNKATLVEQFHQGQLVGYVITAVGIVGLLIALWKSLVIFSINRGVSVQLKSNKPNINNPLGRVLKVAEDNPNVDTETLELKLEEAVLKERPRIESGLPIIKIIAAIAPLIGLLGTVTGMIQTFQAITMFGAGDPKNMAGGISAALITTVQGLCVAIPMVILHTILNGRAKRIIHVLDEQSTGIIAENAERTHK